MIGDDGLVTDLRSFDHCLSRPLPVSSARDDVGVTDLRGLATETLSWHHEMPASGHACAADAQPHPCAARRLAEAVLAEADTQDQGLARIAESADGRDERQVAERLMTLRMQGMSEPADAVDFDRSVSEPYSAGSSYRPDSAVPGL